MENTYDDIEDYKSFVDDIEADMLSRMINTPKKAQTMARGGTDNIPGGRCHLAHLHQVYMC